MKKIDSGTLLFISVPDHREVRDMIDPYSGGCPECRGLGMVIPDNATTWSEVESCPRFCRGLPINIVRYLHGKLKEGRAAPEPEPETKVKGKDVMEATKRFLR